ncbi:LIM and calponin like proteiny domains-containing protein 1-like protein [Willisornis vidua]|uniref:LIM and calponin like proteiny domains-containing protein 1-like protein n=1 Tax=Willisornis vidua TaxID=1566151 RepID=A0ABQ9CRZ6_9PASS|nr:LIM and calponin like proteiny domains-containing protein 1-like protein [Willisornis vidua]
MDGREDAECDCQAAFAEAQRWVEAVTGKSFGTKDFRAALENGVLLCDLINKIKPGIVKKINRLSTPIAGLATDKGIKCNLSKFADDKLSGVIDIPERQDAIQKNPDRLEKL